MYPPLRLRNQYPVDLGIESHGSPDSVESLFSRYSNLLDTNSPRQTVNPNLANAIRAYQLQPINRYDAAHTTNNLVSYGLTPANTQLNTIAAQAIKPLDQAKLDFAREKSRNELEFKQSKQDDDNEIRKTRADVYKFKAEHPGMKFDFSGPTIKVADPITGEVHDTGRPTGHLSDKDKLELQGRNQLSAIGARGTEQRLTNFEGDVRRNERDLANIKAKGEEDRKTNEAKPNSATLPTQERVRIFENAQKLANDPQYKDWIKIDPSTKTFTIKAPNEDTHHIISSKIYGSGSDVQIPASNNGQNQPNTSENKDTNKNQSFSSSTTKRFISKGVTYNIPMDKIDAFKKDNPDAQEVESR